jgi:hypothetical protein
VSPTARTIVFTVFDGNGKFETQWNNFAPAKRHVHGDRP